MYELTPHDYEIRYVDTWVALSRPKNVIPFHIREIQSEYTDNGKLTGIGFHGRIFPGKSTSYHSEDVESPNLLLEPPEYRMYNFPQCAGYLSRRQVKQYRHTLTHRNSELQVLGQGILEQQAGYYPHLNDNETTMRSILSPAPLNDFKCAVQELLDNPDVVSRAFSNEMGLVKFDVNKNLYVCYRDMYIGYVTKDFQVVLSLPQFKELVEFAGVTVKEVA